MRARTIEPTAEEAVERDPIEDEGWFQAFPESHRERILSERASERELDAEAEDQFRRETRRVVVAGSLVIGIFGILTTGFSIVPCLLYPLLGAGVGWTWATLRTGPLLSPLIAMPAYLLARIACGRAGVGVTDFLGLVGGMMAIGFLSAYLGSRREVRSYE